MTEENDRDKLITGVCDRFMFGKLVDCKDTDSDHQPFETRIKIRKQKSILLQIAEKVKEKR